MHRIIALILLAAFAALPAHATDLVVPQSFTSVEGDSNNRWPFGIGFDPVNSMRWQQVYGAREFVSVTSPIKITQISFRPDASFGGVFSASESVQIDLSTTHSAPDALNPTFALNVGADDITVVPAGTLALSSNFSGPVNGPKAFDILINLTTPFIYNPANGNLLLDVRNFSSATAFAPNFDASVSTTDGLSRQYGSVGSTTRGNADSSGLITRFTFAPVPEPSSFMLAAFGFVGLLAWGWRRRKLPE